ELLTMWFTSWLRNKTPHAGPARRRPCLELLEDRTVSSTFLVTNTGDNGGVNPAPGAGTGTLRQAIIDANAHAGADVIGLAAVRPAHPTSSSRSRSSSPEGWLPGPRAVILEPHERGDAHPVGHRARRPARRRPALAPGLRGAASARRPEAGPGEA